MRLFISTAFRSFFYLLLFFLLLSLLCYFAFVPVPTRQSSELLDKKIQGLHETAAIWVPHFDIDDGALRNQYAVLFEKVETGQQLTPEQGLEYRQLYQQLLRQNQAFFSHFDSQLIMATDLAMDQQNNVGGQGVEGCHDHHDESSRNNFMQVEASYAVLQNNKSATNRFFSITRIKHAIGIYKNLNDILFHLATVPHTKSIPYQEIPGEISAERRIFESMLQAFKSAQFMEVNSPEYQAEIRMALSEYKQLVLISEELVLQHLSPFELKLVGNWGGWQSLTPRVSDKVVSH